MREKETVSQLKESLKAEPRFLVEVELRPVQGERFQATGFPEIGPATYTRPDGTEMLLVESSQSMANRMEEICWDYSRCELVSPLEGMPYVRVDLGNGNITSSIIEAHRLNSPYILESAESSFMDMLIQELGAAETGPIDIRLLARTALKYDPNSIIHGVFLAKKDLAGGRFRLKRLLSSFIEAEGVRVAESGGVKIDIVNPSGDTTKGFGHVPFHRVEFVAERIMAFFNFDTDLLFSYGLGDTAEDFLLALSLWKIQKLLHRGLRLRTACDLEPVGDVLVKRPYGVALPPLSVLEDDLPDLIKECAKDGLFADPPITEVKFSS